MYKTKSKSLTKNANHILHPLNLSKTKSTFSFEKSKRFQSPKSHSPNKFYNLPSAKINISFSIGKGNRPNIQKPDFIAPNKYNIISQFEKTHQRTSSDAFGISREAYYKGLSFNNKNVGPGSYHVSRQLGSNHFYIGQKLVPLEDRNCSPKLLNISSSLSKLSTYKKQNGAVRMKTQYYPKSKLQFYDNKVPGPGTYEKNELGDTARFKNTMTTFGATQRLKTDKPSWTGPGRYDVFSQFGQQE